MTRHSTFEVTMFILGLTFYSGTEIFAQDTFSLLNTTDGFPDDNFIPWNTTDIFLGFSPTMRSSFDSWSSAVVIPWPDLEVSTNGAVVGWTVFFAKNLPIACQVWRKVGELTYTLVGQTMIDPEGRVGVVEKALEEEEALAVETGDVIGFAYSNGSVIRFDECEKTDVTMYGLYSTPWEMGGIGTTYTFSRLLHNQHPCRIYSMQARLELADDPGNASKNIVTQTPMLAVMNNASMVPAMTPILDISTAQNDDVTKTQVSAEADEIKTTAKMASYEIGTNTLQQSRSLMANTTSTETTAKPQTTTAAVNTSSLTKDQDPSKENISSLPREKVLSKVTPETVQTTAATEKVSKLSSSQASSTETTPAAQTTTAAEILDGLQRGQASHPIIKTALLSVSVVILMIFN